MKKIIIIIAFIMGVFVYFFKLFSIIIEWFFIPSNERLPLLEYLFNLLFNK